MDGRKVAVLCVIGVLGSALIGYCIYFDRKRRNDPDYKRKVFKSKLNFFPSFHSPCYIGRSTLRQNSSVSHFRVSLCSSLFRKS